MFVIWQHLPNALNMYVCMYIYIYLYIHFPFGHNVIYFVIFAYFVAVSRWRDWQFQLGGDYWDLINLCFELKSYPIFIQTFSFAQSLFNLIWQAALFCMIILYRDLLYYVVFYILYYLYLGAFHASDSLSLNGSHPDMLFNLYFFSVICRINIFLLLLLLLAYYMIISYTFFMHIWATCIHVGK